MPELPEVQTTVNGLNSTVRGKKIVDVWADYKSGHKMHRGSIKEKKFFELFKKKVIGAKILRAERRAKNILIHLSNEETILVHMKMTGHFVYNKPEYPFVRLSFKLDNGKTLYFSDMRRFAKVTLVSTKNLETTEHLKNIGPEPLDAKFGIKDFESRLMMKPKGKIKTVLMDPTIVAGIGNIYSDEILWRADAHPLSIVAKIPKRNVYRMFKAMREVLKKGIDFGGDSMSDYRNIDGERGNFQNHHRAYRRTNERCLKKGCNGKITRLVVGGRSAHFCSTHQKLFK